MGRVVTAPTNGAAGVVPAGGAGGRWGPPVADEFRLTLSLPLAGFGFAKGWCQSSNHPSGHHTMTLIGAVI